jgi:hypothetical protein
VHHHGVDADKLQQGNVPGKVPLEGFVHHGVATILDHDGLAIKPTDIRQRFDEYVSNIHGH